jgi:hypothetical protein
MRVTAATRRYFINYRLPLTLKQKAFAAEHVDDE